MKVHLVMLYGYPLSIWSTKAAADSALDQAGKMEETEGESIGEVMEHTLDSGDQIE
jgi:hypothetical protein